ncbi:hypothetical protein Poly51_00600 [Rubripirellula tenax]|uniref:SGNH hydrolase-type esterase domain-containing protein n=1 Tax=Rubripirellula tenax TaxID=2528015 RepID=A0A5C6FEB6_9BACT|nr:GDSL-type esterase/lipase family protein [Rubripirellula tenax]TWU59788.1 hypothetical protein Poly51_00600 [Rubripirellula tenax]
MIWLFLLAGVLNSGQPLLQPGDRVAIVGGTFVERMQDSGTFEAELQSRRPEWKLSFRNLGWSGDDVHGIARKRFDGPEEGYQRILADVETADPTVVLVAYGASEASDGAAAVERFEAGLMRLVGDLRSSGNKGRRVILVAPVATPGYRSAEYTKSVERIRAVIAKVAKQTDTPELAVDWKPSPGEVTHDGLVPNSVGYQTLATRLADRLVGPTGGAPRGGDGDRLAAAVVAKDELFFHRYRPQNETYLMLFRKHEQGNNAAEIPRFDPLIQAADGRIWATARALKTDR